MEINLGSNFGGNIGVRPETAGTYVEKSEKPGTSCLPGLTSGLAAEKELDALAAAEPTVDVPESELRRDDALGKLLDSVFNFPAPPPPKFE